MKFIGAFFKKRLLVVCVFSGLIASSMVCANKDYELFLQANQACKTGRYQQAVSLYRQITVCSGAVLYNMGYALYAVGDYKGALIALREAERRASGVLFKKIRHAITQANFKLGLDKDPWWYRYALELQRGIWLGTLQILCLIALFSLLSMTVIFRGTYGFSGRRRWYMSGVILILVVSIVMIEAHYYIQGYIGGRWAVVIPDKLSVFVMPHKDSHVVSEVNGGGLVKLVDENGAWCKMHYLRAKGWVQINDLHLVKSA